MIFLDAASGTKPYQEVVDTIVDVLQNHWGNASSDTSFGYDAKSIVDNVTQQVANDVNCSEDEIIWTSGACEANSLAINGILSANHISVLYTTRLEHTSIVETINHINPGIVFFINNNKCGFVDLKDLESKLSECSKNIKKLVSISFANSEIGVIQDIKAISDIVHKYNGVLHVDATQLYPWKQIDVKAFGIDLMSVSGQKLHCVKGIGFLYVNKNIKINPIIYGSQQNKRRGGTYPTHLIAAFGKALKITRNNNSYQYVSNLTDVLYECFAEIKGVYLNGPFGSSYRLPNNISLTINGVKAEEVVAMCDEQDIIIAKGSACQSYKTTPSNALLAIGLSEEQALSTIRITVDEFNTIDEIERATKTIKETIEILRRY